MYKIETSVGDVFFDTTRPLSDIVDRSTGLSTSKDIIFADENLQKLKKLYKLNCITITCSDDKYFLNVYLDDSYYGVPEYRILLVEDPVQKELQLCKEKIATLEEKIVMLKDRIHYNPGVPGKKYKELEQDFIAMQKE